MRITRIVGDSFGETAVDPVGLFALRVFRWAESDLIAQLKRSTRHGRLCPLIENLQTRFSSAGLRKQDHFISDKAV